MFGIVTNQWNLVKETLLPVMYDVQRRLELMKSTKAYVQRRGFAKHLNLIANVSTEDLLKAMALHGEAADIRTLMQDANVDPALKRALGGVLQSTANIIGLEGHRSQIRLRGHAAGWHYGNAHLFVTPNLADVRAPLMLQLHLQTNGIAEVEAQSICLDWDDEIPGLPTAATMRRIIARDPVSQARFFHLMMKIFFEELLGIEPTFQKERYAVGFPRCFEDGMATSLYGGIFGDIAALCGPLETQGESKQVNRMSFKSCLHIYIVDDMPYDLIDVVLCAYLHTYIHTYIHNLIRTYIQTYIHTYMHTHMIYVCFGYRLFEVGSCSIPGT